MQFGANQLDAIAGLEAVIAGTRFILLNPRLWGYALVPVGWLIVLTFGLGGFGIWAGWHASGSLLGADLSLWGNVASWLLTIVLSVTALLVAFLLALALAQPLSGFALEVICRAQEDALCGYAPPSPSLLSTLAESTRVALVTLVAGVLVLGPLFVVSLVFPPAAVVTVPLKFLVSAWLLAWNFLDYPLTLHGLNVRARLRWVGQNFGAFTVFGLTWAALLFVPGLFFLVLPLGVAGATRLVVNDGLTEERA